MASRTALPPYSFLPHDSYYSGHHEDAAPPAAVPELRELERQIKEGLREAATAHREMPDMAELPIFGFRNRQRNNNLRALLSALSYRHGTLVHFDNLIHRSKEEVLSPSRCAKIAEECGLLVPPPVQDKMPYPRFSWQANKEGK
ncbi:hypothetical protein JCM6882_001265 [Rhodosporidiobolus microsporus]